MWHQYSQNLIIERWPEIAGPEIACVTRAERMVKGKLFVTVRDSTWAYHLTLLKIQLSEQINKFAGEKVVEDIYFKVGPLQQEEQELSAFMGNNNNIEENKPGQSSSKSNQKNCTFLSEIRKLRNMVSLNHSANHLAGED